MKINGEVAQLVRHRLISLGSAVRILATKIHEKKYKFLIKDYFTMFMVKIFKRLNYDWSIYLLELKLYKK